MVKSRRLKQTYNTRRVAASKTNSPLEAEFQFTIEGATPSADDMTVDPIYPMKVYFENPAAIDVGGLSFENVASGH